MNDFVIGEMTDEQALQLREQLEILKIQLAQASVAMEQAKNGISTFDEEENELRRKVAEVVAKKRTARLAYETEQKERKRLDDLRAKNELKLKAFMSEKANKDAFDRMQEEFDRLTSDKFWYASIMPHQRDGAKRLAAVKRAILGDKRGLGKTLTAIAWLDMINAKKVIIFTPKDISKNFEREVRRWAPHQKVQVLTSMSTMARNAFLDFFEDADEGVVILNYEAWRKDDTLVERLINCRFDTAILDEVHYIKNPNGQAFDGVKTLIYGENYCASCGSHRLEQYDVGMGRRDIRCAICLQEKRNANEFCSIVNVLSMSGTTIINKPQDIWPPLYLTDRLQFNNLNQFLNTFAEQEYGRWVFQYGGQERLQKRLGTRFIRRTDETANVKFPPQDKIIHRLQFDTKQYPDQWRVFQEIKKGAIKMNDEVALNIVAMLAMITRRRQAVVWPAGIQIKDPKTNEVLFTADAHESIKMDKAVELIKQIVEDEEDRVVVFCTFKEALKELERRLNVEKISCVRYDGDASQHLRDAVQLDFDIKTASKTDYRWDVMLGQYQTASTGLNLTGARQMILLDRFWSPKREEQAEGRIQRLDSTDTSIVHVLHVEGSVDDWMEKLIDGKAEDIGDFEKLNDKSELVLMMERMMNEDDVF